MNIYLVRHAIAESISATKANGDSERSLTEDGFNQASMMSTALRKLDKSLDMVLSSPYKRALQTAEFFAKSNSIEVSKSNKLAPGVSIDSLLTEIESIGDASDLMLVGHEPDMGEIAAKILGGGKMFNLPFKKGAILCIQDADAPSVLPGKLSFLVTPEIITSLQA